MNTDSRPLERPSPAAVSANRRIVTALREADARLLARHPLLGRNDLVSMVFFLGACGTIAALVVGWFSGTVPTVAAIIGLALALSVLHELEHDLIHDLYLAQPIIRPTVLTVIWMSKASVDPWLRGRWHLWHHRVSGQPEDVEERLIGLGMPWGPYRVLITLLPLASLFIKPSLKRAVVARVAAGGKRPDFRYPRAGWFFQGMTGLFVCLPLIAIGGLVADAAWAWPLLVLWVLPNIIRHTAIVIMSSNSHYTAITRGAVVEQNQIIDHPMFWPLQVFCWNFGATHVLHHFMVRQPFWRRTMVFSAVRQTLIENGVPANDLGTFRRANRRLA